MDEVELLNQHVVLLFENLKRDMVTNFNGFDKRFQELEKQVNLLKESISNVRFLVKIAIGFVVISPGLALIFEFLKDHFH